MNTRRLEKLASTVRSIVSDAILNRLSDPRISPMTSVTRVEVTADLQIAKIFISVLGDEADGRRTLSGLMHAHGRVQSLLAKQLHTRHCPSLRFELDESLRRAARTMRLIDESLGTSPTESANAPDLVNAIEDETVFPADPPDGRDA